MTDVESLYKAVIDKLSTVIDPETGADVIRMRLIQQLEIDSSGKVNTIFRPSSPLCPIAVPLAISILQAIEEVDGVTSQQMTVIDYIGADELNEAIQSIFS